MSYRWDVIIAAYLLYLPVFYAMMRLGQIQIWKKEP